MKNTEKTMDKLVALCKAEALYIPAVRYTEDLQIHGISDLSALS